jgi:hypothetical protein
MNLAARAMPLMLAAALAAGLSACGSEAAPGSASAQGHPASGSTAPAGSASGQGGTSGQGSASGQGNATGQGRAAGAGSGNPAELALLPAVAKRLVCPGPAVPPAAAGQPGGPAQSIPAGFTPVAVVECLYPDRVAPAPGGGTGERKLASVTGLSGLMTSLRHAAAAGNPTGPLCLGRPVVPWLVLIGKDGQLIRPLLPNVRCGTTVSPVLASLKAMTWINLGSSSSVLPNADRLPPGTSAAQPAPAQ